MSDPAIVAVAEAAGLRTAEVIRDELRETMGAMSALSDTLSKSVRSTISATSDTLRDEVQAKVAGLTVIADRLTKDVSDALASLEERSAQQNAALAKAVHDLQTANDKQRAELARIKDEAQKVAAQAASDKAVGDQVFKAAEQAAQDADRKKAEAQDAEDRAHKAMSLLTLASDHEVARAVETMEFKAKEKAALQELARQREEMENKHDLTAVQIQRGIEHYYPELAARLAELAEQTDTEKE